MNYSHERWFVASSPRSVLMMPVESRSRRINNKHDGQVAMSLPSGFSECPLASTSVSRQTSSNEFPLNGILTFPLPLG